VAPREVSEIIIRTNCPLSLAASTDDEVIVLFVIGVRCSSEVTRVCSETTASS
jgi:hypothetical protein